MNLRSATLIAVGLIGVPVAAHSDIISTTPGNFAFSCLGASPSCGQTFGQSFTVTGADTFLESFGFEFISWEVPSGGTVPLNVTLRIFEWNGTGRVGSELFASESTRLTQAGVFFQDFSVGVNLVSGSQYIAYVDASGQGNISGPSWQVEGATSWGFNLHRGDIRNRDVYAGGHFFYEFAAGSDIWTSHPYDTSFRALLSPAASVPEPATLTLLGLGLVGIGFSRRRRTA